MIKNISVGIDIGSSLTRVVVGEFVKGEKNPKVIGVGIAPTFGLRHGYVVNTAQAIASVKNAIAQAEKSSGAKIRRAFVALSGATLRGETSSGSAIISKADGEVTSLDVSKAMEDAEDNLSLGNKKIVHSFPVSYRLDGKEVQGRPLGMRGTKLEVKALFVTYSIVHLEDLLGVLAEAGVETLDVVASPVSAQDLCLSEKQKIVGVALVDIGAEKSLVSVFENGLLISVHTFSIGSSDITNDIALGLKIPLEQAEDLKLGTATEEFPKKKLDEIIEARLCDIFESIDNHFKKLKRSELLPAGVVFIGGGSSTPGILELSKSILKLPSSLGTTEMFNNTKTKLRDSAWFPAIGLLSAVKSNGNFSTGTLDGLLRDLKASIKSGLKQLMP
ncbi:MAG: cell division protein FtsA [Candidatus Paceibacterota bacterium]|jgi:cell division protein FtsA